MTIDRKGNKPIYIQIYEDFIRALEKKAYKPGEYLPSERDLSSRYKVDRLTVRRALELLVEEGVIEKKAGRGTKVKIPPSKNASKLGNRVIAFVLPRGRNSIDRITEPFNSSLFYEVEKEARKFDYNLLYTTVDTDGRLPKSMGSMDGLILVSQIPLRTLKDLRAARIPAVTINRPNDFCTMILEDRETGIREAVNHLLGHGHRRIFFLSGPQGYFSTDAGRAAYLACLNEFDPAMRPMLIAGDFFTFDCAYNAMAGVLSAGGVPPTAVLAGNDMMALGAIEAVKAAGLSVPEDLSIVGFDDIENCLHNSPKLSTVRVDIPLIASTALDYLLTIIRDPSREPVKIIIPCRLVVRGSTGPANEQRGAQ